MQRTTHTSREVAPSYTFRHANQPHSAQWQPREEPLVLPIRGSTSSRIRCAPFRVDGDGFLFLETRVYTHAREVPLANAGLNVVDPQWLAPLASASVNGATAASASASAISATASVEQAEATPAVADFIDLRKGKMKGKGPRRPKGSAKGKAAADAVAAGPTKTVRWVRLEAPLQQIMHALYGA